MKCPKCSSNKLKVIDKRDSDDSLKNRRRRECIDCGNRFTTYEHIVEDDLLFKIRKRDGKIVDFDSKKITNAIFQAAKSVGGSDIDEAKRLSKKIVEFIKQKFKDEIPGVEDVQDIVERVLVKEGHSKTAKAYILYREQRKKLRETKTTFINVQKVIGNYLNQKKHGYLIASFLFAATPLPSNMLFITYGLMRAKSLGIYVGFWFGRTISYIIMIYFGNAVLTPILEIFEDRLTAILLIDGIGIGMIVLFASVNWTLLITKKKLKSMKPKLCRF